MDLLTAIILGIIQGLTEFLPVSSTAHLTLVGELMGLVDKNAPEHWTAFIAVIQLGTMLAVIIYFYKEIFHIPQAFFKENLKSNRLPISKQSYESRLGWQIILGSVPVFIVGFTLKKLIEGDATKNLVFIAFSLIIFALILVIAEKKSKFTKEMKDISLFDTIIIGIFQCFALFPGASRSGTTISGALFCGLKRETAARFSFLLSIPAVFGSGMLEFFQAIKYISTNDLFAMIISTVVSGVIGYVSIAYLLKYLQSHTTFVFIYYRILLGLLILGLFIAKVL